MGLLKFEGRRRVEDFQTCGQEIQEKGEKKIAERDSALIWDQIEAIDDNDLALIEEARQDAEAVAGMSRVTSGFESDSADVICVLRPENIGVDYTGGLSDAMSFEDSSVDFQDISDEADQTSEEMQIKMEQLMKRLEDVF